MSELTRGNEVHPLPRVLWSGGVWEVVCSDLYRAADQGHQGLVNATVLTGIRPNPMLDHPVSLEGPEDALENVHPKLA